MPVLHQRQAVRMDGLQDGRPHRDRRQAGRLRQGDQERAMSLTTVDKVKKLLGSNYGPLADGTLPDLEQFIDSANSVVTQAASYAVSQRRITLDSVQKELIERW